MKLENEIIAATIAIRIREASPKYRAWTSQIATDRMKADVAKAKRWLNMCNQEGVKLQCQNKSAGTLKNS